MLQPSQVQTSLWGMCSDIQANFQAAGLQTIDDKTEASKYSQPMSAILATAAYVWLHIDSGSMRGIDKHGRFCYR